MEKSQEFKSKSDNQTTNLTDSTSSPSQEQIRNLLLVMTDREQKLSELASQQQRIFLWRMQYVRLEREWNEVSRIIKSHIFT